MKYLCATRGCFDVAVRGTGQRARCEDCLQDDEPEVGGRR